MDANSTSTSTATQTIVLNVSVESDTVARDLKRVLRHMRGVTKVTIPRRKPKSRLLDPETGKYLNDETMLAIEDTRKGVGVTTYSSFDDFEKAMRKL